jgi:hypothetical protein
MKSYRFYTYDLKGKDITLTIQAPDLDSAWVKFHKMFTVTHPVDMVREI